MKRLGWRTKAVYAFGGLGTALVTVIHMFFLVYYFLPPVTAGLPFVIPQGSIRFGLTIIGLILASKTFLDAVTDPLVASWSDNSRSRRGKRIPFMRYSALGFAASYVLVFYVPMRESISTANVVWLGVWLGVSAIFLTLYTVPHSALIAELAEHPDDRIDLATWNSVFWFAGLIIVNFSTGIWGVLEGGFHLSRGGALRVSFVVLASLGWIFLMIPAIFIRERRDETASIRHQPLLPAMKKVLGNRNFAMFLAANTLYTVATYIFETGLIYYITILARYRESAQGILTPVIGGITFISYPIVNHFAKKRGKKTVLIFGFILFAAMFAAISVLGIPAVPVWLAMGLVIMFAPVPQSIFGTLPNAITADCAGRDRADSGEDSAGMYFAVNGFIIKLGGVVASVLFTSLLLLGKDLGDDLGIRVAALSGGVLAVAGLLVMRFYNENEVLKKAASD